MFLAILLLLALTLGFITLGPLNSTTMHIPVIIGSIVLGPKSVVCWAARLGSSLKNTTAPTPLSFVFLHLFL